MPLYDYQCTSCGHVVEIRHGFDDTYDQACPACGGTLRRVINPAPIIFKGSGFYVTDSRKKTASDKPAEAKADAKPARDAAPAASEAKPAADKPKSSTEPAA